MTHLSDMSYLQRCSIWFSISVFLCYSMYRSDRFKCLRQKSILSGELKTVISLMLILTLMLQFMWDILMTYLKYKEGYINYNGNIVTKPFILWTPSHQQKAQAFDYVQCVTFSLEAGIFLLLQSFWNYLSNAVANKTFMTSFEFKFYIVWALISVALFPILQWLFRNDAIKREAVPQLTFAIEMLLVACLGLRTHFRFKRLITLSQRIRGNGQRTILVKMSYFKDMNRLMSFILLSYSAGFIILCVDALTSNMVINKNKFAMDMLIANTNVCTVYLLIILISIFHPRPQYASHSQSEISSNNDSNIQNSIKSIGNDKSFARPVASSYSLNNAVSSSFSSQKQQPLNMAIEDPYSNKTIMFSMMSAPLQTQVGLATSGIKVDASRSQKWDPQEEKNIYTQNQSMSSHRLSLETNNSYNVSASSEAHLNHQRGNVAPDWFWGSADRRDP